MNAKSKQATNETQSNDQSGKEKKTTNGRVPAVMTDVFNSTLTINFANGKELQIDVNDLSDDIKLHAMLHGVKQKLVDAAAIPRDTVTGKEVSIDDKYAAVKTVYDRLVAAGGTWNAVREGGTGSHAGGLFLRAMCAITGKKPEEMRELLASKTKEEISALKKNNKVVAKMAEIQISDAGDSAHADNLLDELSR